MKSCYNTSRRNIEDDLNIFENGRQSQFLGNGRRPQVLGNGRRLNFVEMEGDLNIFENGRQPQYF